MSDIRNGKIARLPYGIREELNRRLQDGELCLRLVQWLNGLPEVQAILKDQFGGRPVSGQNLSEWKQGGYADWLRHHEARAFVNRLHGEAIGLQNESVDGEYQEVDPAENLAVVLGSEMGQIAFDLLKDADNPQERWRRIREVLHELGQFRRHNHRAARLKIYVQERQREEEELETEAEEAELKKQKDKLLAPLVLRANGELSIWTEMFGGGEDGRKLAALTLELQRDLPPGSLTGPPYADLSNPPPDQALSNPIKPDQTKK